jgi:nitrogen-specific signal transduction histidine kinase
MSAGRTKIGRKQDQAIAGLLTAGTHAEAAVAAGISEATLQRWLRDPGFVAAYRQARRQVVEAAVAQLQRATSNAVATLERNLDCKNPSVEVRAAATILERATKAVELVDLAERVEELERLLKEVQSDEPSPPGR